MDNQNMERVEMKPIKLSPEEREREAAFLKNASGEDLQKLFRQAQAQKGKQLNLTSEEAKRIDDAFEKPEFMDLFREYVDDISDPKNMEEYDQYLRQLEEQGEIPEDEEVIRPEKGFVVKTKAQDTGSKIFINCAGTDKVPVPTQNSTTGGVSAEDTTGSKGKGSYWSIPYIHTSVRMDRDKNDQPCHVYDILFNTETLRLAEKHAQFKALVVQTALESLEENGKAKLKDPATGKYDYTVLKQLRYKGHTVRPHKLKRQFENQPKAPTAPAAPAATPSKAPPKAAKAEAPVAEVRQGPIAPRVAVVHRGEIELSDSLASLGSLNQPLSRRPKQLVLRLELPLLQSGVGEMALDIKGGFLEFACGGVYELKHKLPYPVDEASGDAKYSKTQKILTVTLTVLPWTEAEVEAERRGMEAAAEEERLRREQQEAARRREEEAQAATVVKKGFLSKPAPQREGGDSTAGTAGVAEATAEEGGGGAGGLIEDLGSYEERKEAEESQGGAEEGAAAREAEGGEAEEAGAEAEEPRMSFRQNQHNVTVVVRVEGVRPDSVQLEVRRRALRLACAAQGRRYAAEVHLGGAVEEGGSRFDVTEANVVVVLRKRKPGRWAALTLPEPAEDPADDDQPPQPAGGSPNDAQGQGLGNGAEEEAAARGGGENEGAGPGAESKVKAKKTVRWGGEQEGGQGKGAVGDTAAGGGEEEGEGEGEGEGEFEAAAAWAGSRAGRVFKRGPRGLGYYRDKGAGAGVQALDAADESAECESAAAEGGDVEARAEAEKGGLRAAGEAKGVPKMAFTNSLAFDLD